MVVGELEGKVALVTGSSRGLGRFYALQLAQAGADVIIHDVHAQAASEFGEAASGEAVAAEIQALQRRSIFLVADLTIHSQVDALVQQALAQFGHIDILVNNAGGDIGAHTPRPEPNDALDIDPEDIRSVVERNLLTTMLTCKYVGRHMREQRSGKIINISSVAWARPTTQGIIYAAAKAGVTHYTRCLAEQLRPFDVNVNAIAPGPTVTGRFLATRTVTDRPDRSRLQQLSQPQDLAQIVLFLASSQSDVLTGETITCWNG